MKVTLISHTPFSEYVIMKAGLITRGRQHPPSSLFSKERFIRKLIEKGHHSILEFGYATFLVEGVSRALLAQITRHRLASFAVESQRHTKPKSEIVIPPTITQDPELKGEYKEIAQKCFALYEKMVERGIPKEDARFILPNATPTAFIISANFREWRHILQLRLASDAQWEIRELCREIAKQLSLIAPSVFEDLVKKRNERGG
ncbi:MAG: FAD-dependent thymidylate synthase [Thermoprotei archaeon]|nr:MAG: FAD-dependent thymidylate synthase [Thermoprotei archaeon]